MVTRRGQAASVNRTPGDTRAKIANETFCPGNFTPASYHPGLGNWIRIGKYTARGDEIIGATSLIVIRLASNGGVNSFDVGMVRGCKLDEDKRWKDSGRLDVDYELRVVLRGKPL